MDEKWKKLSKKECSSSSKFSLPRSFSTKSVSSKSSLLRSSSQKNSCSTTSSSSSSSSSSKCPLPRCYSQKASISHKCSSVAKEQKARFYIMRRCVAMLVCWHKHGDSEDQWR